MGEIRGQQGPLQTIHEFLTHQPLSILGSHVHYMFLTNFPQTGFSTYIDSLGAHVDPTERDAHVAFGVQPQILAARMAGGGE